MKNNFRWSLLVDKFFLCGISILLLNDLVLKYIWPGLITGKLSDVCGLFVFPYFWSVFFERRTKFIYIFTTIFFVFWKSAFSTSLVDWVNSALTLNLSRVVDVSDLLALAVLPISFKYFQHLKSLPVVPQRKTAPVLICVISLFAFVATSQPRKTVNINLPIGEKYKASVKMEDIRKLRHHDRRLLKQQINDSVMLFSFEKNNMIIVNARVTVHALDSLTSMINLDTVRSYTTYGVGFFFPRYQPGKSEMKKFDKDDYKELFKSAVIDGLKDTSYFKRR